MGASLFPVRLSCRQTHTRIVQFQKRAVFAKWFHFSERTALVRDWHLNLSSPLAILEKKEFHTAVCFVMESAFCYRWQLPILYHISPFINISFLCWDFGNDRMLSICLVSDSWQCARCNIEFPLRYSFYLFSSPSISANFHSFQKRNKDGDI